MTTQKRQPIPLRLKHWKKFLVLICICLGLNAFSQEKKELFFADPTIYVEDGVYYLTGTGGQRQGLPGFALLISNDLKTWTPPAGGNDSTGRILTRGDQTFGARGFWAPQIFKADDTYYLTYTADEQTVLAQSTSLLGPYRQKEVRPIDGSVKNIDSFIFKDDDGKYYLYHVRLNQGNYLWVAEFDLEKGKIKPETLTKCFDQTEPWEATPNYQSDPIMEGPTVIKLKNKYYLFYSANHFMNIDYAVGYAVSDSPYGPWIKQKDSPILHRSIVGENGSGHGDFFEGSDGRLYYVYHVHFSQNQASPRKTRIVPVIREWNVEKNLYSFRVKGEAVIVPVLK
jgi:beta-xylosidase